MLVKIQHTLFLRKEKLKIREEKLKNEKTNVYKTERD